MTYTSGYSLKATKDITTHDISNLCINLEKAFGNGYKFEPEPITEGGIVFKNWPGKTDNMYKTMRICFYYHGKWPWINNDQITTWMNNPSIKLLSKGTEIQTFLKSSNGAPQWNIDELKIFESQLLEIGLKRNDKYPTKGSLL